MDGTAILKELLSGLPFIITGLLVWRMRSIAALLVVALAWLSHGFYDIYRDILFVNPGEFSWYPAFCALVDVTVVGYLLLSYKKLTVQTALTGGWQGLPHREPSNIVLKNNFCSQREQKPVTYMIKPGVIERAIEPHTKR